MHNSENPIIHDDLSCDTIYIQHNGLIKIGSIAPDIVNNHVKTCVDFSKSLKNMHYMAPETRDISFVSMSEQSTNISNPNENEVNLNPNATSTSQAQMSSVSSMNLSKNNKSTAVDIYAFGIVALEVCLD